MEKITVDKLPSIEVIQRDWTENFTKLTLWEYIVYIAIENDINSNKKRFVTFYSDDFYEIDIDKTSAYLPIVNKNKFEIANLLERCQNYGYIVFKKELDKGAASPLCDVHYKYYIKLCK